MNFIDLFAGAGGLSEGFIRQGMVAVAHVEMNLDACTTLKTRTAYYYLLRHGLINEYYRYLNGQINRDQLYALAPVELLASIINEKITDASINGIFTKIDELINNLPENDRRIDLIVGGPPCQAYSLVGRAIKNAQDEIKRQRNEVVEEDPRNFLYQYYCRFLRQYRPRMFVFENVPGLITARNGEYFENMQLELQNCGYEIAYEVLNASNFGVLQNRRRVLLIGWRIDTGLHYPELENIEHDFIVNDLLNDLPHIIPGEINNVYAGEPSRYLSNFDIRDNHDVLTLNISRPHIERDREIYRHVIHDWNSGHQRLRYGNLPDELRTHNNTTSFIDRFKIVEGDTPACHTMMAHISKDGHYFIHPDINQARSLTVREAARIQSFPDNYYFEGSRTAAFTQIGNAVPPLMAEEIARAIVEELE